MAVFASLSVLLLSFSLAPSPALARSHFAGSTRCVFDHATLKTSRDVCRPHAKVYPAGVSGKVRHAIYDASLIFGMPYSVLLAIAKCESGLNPRARAGHYVGLFQFAPDTFNRGAHRLRKSTGIQARTVWSPQDASYVAGYLFAAGAAMSWSCENR